jgi:hypothetical protein
MPPRPANLSASQRAWLTDEPARCGDVFAAEIERLRAENRRLKVELDLAKAAFAAVRQIIDQHREMSQPRGPSDISESGQTPACGVL